MNNYRERYIEAHSLDFDAENSSCNACKKCEGFHNYYHNQYECPIWEVTL